MAVASAASVGTHASQVGSHPALSAGASELFPGEPLFGGAPARRPAGVQPLRKRVPYERLQASYGVVAVMCTDPACDTGSLWRALEACAPGDIRWREARHGAVAKDSVGVLTWRGHRASTEYVIGCLASNADFGSAVPVDWARAQLAVAIPNHAGVRARGLDDAPTAAARLFGQLELTGAGVSVAVVDTGLDEAHAGAVRRETWVPGAGADACDGAAASEDGGATRYVAYGCTQCDFRTDHEVAGGQDHGTLVSSILATAAPGARLTVVDSNLAGSAADTVQLPPSLADDLFLRARNCHGTTIFSLSWGVESALAGVYGFVDHQVDTVTFHRDDVLVVVAAGNDGSSVVRSPCSGKNTLCVGSGAATAEFFGDPLTFRDVAIERPEVTTARDGGNFYAAHRARPASLFSSRLGTLDGRRKPEVAAVGELVLGRTVGGGARSVQGTSMAAPVVAATMALVTELVQRLSWAQTPGARSCSRGCKWDLSSQAAVSEPAPAAAFGLNATVFSSLLRALAIAATRPCESMFFRDGRAPLRRADSRAAAACGFGELSLARWLAPTAERSVFVYGENHTSGFESVALLGEWVAGGGTPLAVALAAKAYAADDSRTYCFVTTSPQTQVRATLAWRDPPSSLGAEPTFESSLFLSVVIDGEERGGPQDDRGSASNAQHVSAAVNGSAGTRVRVSVAALRVSDQLLGPIRQMYSLVVAGALQRAAVCGSCEPNQLVGCSNEHGRGTRLCSGGQCLNLTTCWGVSATGRFVLPDSCDGRCYELLVGPECEPVACEAAPPCETLGATRVCTQHGKRSVATTSCVLEVVAEPAGPESLVLSGGVCAVVLLWLLAVTVG